MNLMMLVAVDARRTRRAAVALAMAAFGLGCADEAQEPAPTGEDSSPIISPTGRAGQLWLADLLNCSGSLIAAPSVLGGSTNVNGRAVLTARHCMTDDLPSTPGFARFPHAPGLPVRAGTGYRWSPAVDVAIWWLDRPLNAGVLPTIPVSAPIAQGILIGSKNNGVWDPHWRVDPYNIPNTPTFNGGEFYGGPGFTEKGDSGGPWIVAGGCGPDQIHAVTYGKAELPGVRNTVGSRLDVQATNDWLRIQLDPAGSAAVSCGRFLDAYGYASANRSCDATATICDDDSSPTGDPCAKCCSRGEDRPLFYMTQNGAIPGKYQAFAVGRESHGRVQMFAGTTNDVLRSFQQTAPGAIQWDGGPKNVFYQTSNDVLQIEVARNQDGRLEIFYIRDTGTAGSEKLYHQWQLAAGNSEDWSTPEVLVDESVKRFAVGSNSDGRLEVFFIAASSRSSGRLKHIWQTVPNAGWSGIEDWDVRARQVAAAQNQDGRLEVFFTSSSDEIFHKWIGPSGWSGNDRMLGFAKKLDAIRGPSGKLYLFYVGTNDVIYYQRQAVANAGWREEELVLNGDKANEIATVIGGDNRLRVAYTKLDNALRYSLETSEDAFKHYGLNGWAKKIRLVTNLDSRVQLLYIGTDSQMYSQWLTSVWRQP